MSDPARPVVLFVDDVELDLSKYRRGMALARAYDVEIASTVDDALKIASTRHVDAAVLDLKMPPGPLGDVETDHGEETGLVLASRLVGILPNIKILMLSNDDSAASLEPAFKQSLNIYDSLIKLDCKPIDLIRSLDRMFGLRSLTPNVFIVHGHDRDLVEFVQSVVETDLGWTKPIVLDEQAGGGLTIIEKFERFAATAEAVVVIMTPDDIGYSSKNIDAKQFRARQNVLFELGYFYGKFKRRSGRVFVLKKDDLEIPTDLAGIIYIQVGADLKAVRDRLAVELRHLFEPSYPAK